MHKALGGSCLIDSSIFKCFINRLVCFLTPGGQMNVPWIICRAFSLIAYGPNSDKSGSCKKGEDCASLYFAVYLVINAFSISFVSLYK